MSKVKFGADPEFFASYKNEDGGMSVLPPVILRTDFQFPAEENGRHPIFARYGKTYVHEDGAAFEMSTPPSENWKDIFNNLNEARANFEKDVLSKFPDVCDGKLHSLPAMNFQVQRWLNRGPEFEMSTLFGCDADEDVFNMKAKCAVIDASQHPWRYAGGHIHVSGLEEIKKQPLMAIKSMVVTAGLASTAFSDVPELERERLFLYGRPGKFRIQEYSNGEVGVEYRTPSTRWTNDYAFAETVFEWAEVGMNNLLRDGLISSIEDKIMKPAQEAILNVDQEKAKQILSFIASKV